MNDNIYQLCLIAMLLQNILSTSSSLKSTIPLGQDMNNCIHDQGNTFLSGGGNMNYAIIDINATSPFKKLNNPHFFRIYDLFKFAHDKVLTCGDSGIRIIHKNTGITQIENFITETIESNIVIKNTQFVSIAPYDHPKFLILKLEDLTQQSELDIGITDNSIIFQKGFSNFIYLGFYNSNDFISVDYTSLQMITLPKSSNQDNIYSIIEERDKRHLLTLGDTITIVKFDTITSSIIKEFPALTSIQDNYSMKLLLESPILMWISFDDGLYFMNLDTETGALLINEPGEGFCFNPKNMMIGLSEIGGSFKFFTYSISPVVCEDSDCTQCPFSPSICFTCQEKKLESGKCVQNCSETHYYNSDLNRCLLDRCEGDKKYSFQLQKCYFCPDGKEIDLKTEKCYTCREINPNCAECYPGTLECQKCNKDFLLADKKCTFKCKDVNPKCKKFGDDCKCLDYECETKRCKNCSKSPKICEDKDIAELREKASDQGETISGIMYFATPTMSLISFTSLLGAGGIGSMALMSANRLIFSKKIMYINLEKGEIFNSYITQPNNQTQKFNEKNMISVDNMVYKYQKPLFPTFSVYVKIALSLLITALLLILLIFVNKKASNKNFCFAVFYLKKAEVIIHKSSASNFAFDLVFIVTNIDFKKNAKNFILWMISAITLMVHWAVHAKNYSNLIDLEKKDMYVPIETLSQQNFDNFEERKIEDEKNGEIEKKNIKNAEIEVESTQKVIKYKNLAVIEFIRIPLRNREGFEHSKYFQALNIFRNIFFLTLIAGFPQFPPISALVLMFFELQYCVTFIATMWHYQCFRPINFLVNIINSIYILLSMVIILNLHFSDQKSIILQQWLITLNYLYTILEIILTLLAAIIVAYLNSYLLKNYHKKLKRKFAFILNVNF